MKNRAIKMLLIIMATSAIGCCPLGGITDVYANGQLSTAGASKQLEQMVLASSKNYATISESADAPTVYDWETMYTQCRVNLRTQPDTNSLIITTFNVNEKLTCAQFDEEWCAVKYNGEIYYISARYVSEEKLKAAEYSEEDAELLAHAIFAEANTLGENGMMYAGSVILNRVNSDKYPDTIRGVLSQPGQYACWSNGAINKSYTQEAYNIAVQLLQYGSAIPVDIIFQSEAPQGAYIWLHLGNTYFCGG